MTLIELQNAVAQLMERGMSPDTPIAVEDLFRGREIAASYRPAPLHFSPGLPGPLGGPWLFVTVDGAIHAGELMNCDGRRVIRTTNPAGGLHDVFDIPADQIVGHAMAYLGQFRAREIREDR